MNRFARLATRLLDAPRAVVWIADADGEGPGTSEAWPPAPLDEDLLAGCRRVAELGCPAAWRISEDRPAAFAGVPLAGPGGELLGVLAVADTASRRWTEDDLRDLGDLAAACSAQMRLRHRSEAALRDREQAEAAAALAEVAADRMEVLLSRAQLLLRAAEDLGGTSGLAEVRARVSDLVSGDLKPSYVGLVLVGEDGRLHHMPAPSGGDAAWPEADGVYGVGAGWPTARAVREGRTVLVEGRQALEDGYAPEAVAAFDTLGLHTAICVPLPGVRAVVGALVLGWDIPYTIGPAERAVLLALAGYAARAVERALYLDERISVARQLQEAMLTDLPAIEGIETAVLYRPAARQDMVGGDWYDVYPRPGPAGASGWSVTVGDITGHDMAAATVMGQVRIMLRQADHDHPGKPPHHALDALEAACRHIGIPASGTLVHAHLTPRADGHWHLAWTNAGHPPPVLAHHDRTSETLWAHDILLHPSLPAMPRGTHTLLLPPGSTLLLYTDGLVEHRGKDLADAIAHAARLLCAADRQAPLDELLRHLADTVSPPHADDDTVLLVLRTAPRP